jgi:hypothetical protein
VQDLTPYRPTAPAYASALFFVWPRRQALQHQPAVREMKADGLLPEDTRVRISKYLNNLIEQDHRNIKSRTNVTPGFKRVKNAAATISGGELMRRIRKGQFNISMLWLKDTAAPAVWNAIPLNK